MVKMHAIRMAPNPDPARWCTAMPKLNCKPPPFPSGMIHRYSHGKRIKIDDDLRKVSPDFDEFPMTELPH